MKTSAREHLPLAPLLHAYVRAGMPGVADLHHLPGLGPRFAAVLSASAKFLYPAFIDTAPETELSTALVRFYEACVQPPLHAETLRRRVGIVRYGLGYLLRGRDGVAAKAEACLAVTGAYHVPGLGPAFWSALLQGVRPGQYPAWTPATVAGLRRLGLARFCPNDAPGTIYGQLLSAYDLIRRLQPTLSALHVDHFLTLVAGMRGRNLARCTTEAECPVAAAVRQERGRLALRDRIKERGPVLARAQEQLETGLAQDDGKMIGGALAASDPAGSARSPLDWGLHAEELTQWVRRLWEAEEPYAVLAAFWAADPVPGAGLWLPAAVLHLRDAQQFYPWDEDARRSYASLDDAADMGPAAVRYRLFNEGIAWLRARHGLHPLEVPQVLAALGRTDEEAPGTRPAFGGFCPDTFPFLAELAHDNRRDWMECQRDRYHFAVREPMVELCRALARAYITPILGGVHGWDLDTEARSGRALTSICKNAFGRAGPYNTELWITFCRHQGKGPGRRDDVQLFVRLDTDGLRFGMRVARTARAAVRRLRDNLARHAELLFRALNDSGALAGCRFGSTDDLESPGQISSAADLQRWVAGRSFEAGRRLSAEEVLACGEELPGEILLSFDRLLSAYACAAEDDAEPFLARRVGEPAGVYGEADFQRSTFLGGDWLRRARGLLDLKRQLILQGVPGTGKTHVARALARLLTGGREELVRLVQFHPAYSYEEFVEGIKVRSVAVEDRHDVTYPVEDGLLCAFAAAAKRCPADPHVLVIDEINRGNLPRIFGELLYLLEYRDQAVVLPYSRRDFRLPANLYLLATMNAADRSAVLLDQALRRRFSFLDMAPDANVLSAWLQAHPPRGGRAFAERVLGLFERLNARLRADLGPQMQVGQSYFMVPDLDEARLRMVWQHHVRPLLEEQFAGQLARLAAYELGALLDGVGRRGERRRETATAAR